MCRTRWLCQKYGGGTTRFEKLDQEKVMKLYNETPEYGTNGFEESHLPGVRFSLEHLTSEFLTMIVLIQLILLYLVHYKRYV